MSSIFLEWGEQVTIKVVLKFPPNDSCNIRVSFESRYEIWSCFYESWLITFPKVDKERLICFVSCYNDSEVRHESFSLPAKSTKFKVARFSESLGNF